MNQDEEIAKKIHNFKYPINKWEYASGATKTSRFELAHQILPALFKGDEKGLLTPEEMEKAQDIYTPPTKEEWALRPDHEYWRNRRIAKAQQIVTRQENETKAQLDRLDAEQRGYNAGLKRGRQEIPEAVKAEKQLTIDYISENFGTTKVGKAILRALTKPIKLDKLT